MLALALSYIGSLAISMQAPAFRLASFAPTRRLSSPCLCSTPANVGEAKKRFQESYKKILSMPAQGFVNTMLMQQFALIAPNYQYSRVFSVGFESLCSVFLPMTLNSQNDVERCRRSLYVGLGMDADRCKEDATALLLLASGKSEEELWAADDFVKIKESDFKYTFQFGAGLVALMKAVGTEPSAAAISRWCRELKLHNEHALTRDWEFCELELVKMEGMKEMFIQMQAR